MLTWLVEMIPLSEENQSYNPFQSKSIIIIMNSPIAELYRVDALRLVSVSGHLHQDQAQINRSRRCGVPRY